jgi:hypothetical protein
MNRFLSLLLFCGISVVFASAQEIECKVTIDTRQLPAEVKMNLDDFESQVTSYVNSYRWTREDLKGEKIKCSFDIRITGSPSENSFSAQIFVGSSRPLYKQVDRKTAMARILDDQWNFNYVKYQSMTHDESRFDPLLSFLDFYVYVVLGYDFDSYKPADGTQFFQKASEIVNKARNSAGGGPGWEESTHSTYSRSQLVDEFLNPKFYDFREGFFRYHYRGLDLLQKDEAKARKNTLAALEKIGNVQKKINQNSLIIRLFFETKFQEIAETFSNDPDLTVYTRLGKIDPAHQQKYEEFSRRSK